MIVDANMGLLGSYSTDSIGNGMQSNTAISLKVYLMAILDNYMFRPILAIFRLS
jgi:hypothetical protein